LSQYWDNRFQVTVNKNDAEYYIEPLNMLEYIDIRDKIDLNELEQISDNNHKLILFTLPVIKKLEKIVAIPHISYYDVFDLNAINIVFRPNFISRFTHFL
jgi:tRNA(Ile)-lysidine synthase